MSSKFVRDSILSFIATQAPTESLIDLTSHFEDLKDLATQYNLKPQDPWLGVQFVGSEEVPVSVQSNNVTGKYREIGVIYLHVVAVARLGVHNTILTRAETLRNKFRGQRIATSILIESVSPCNFGEGISLSFEGGYTAGVIVIEYNRDLDL